MSKIHILKAFSEIYDGKLTPCEEDFFAMVALTSDEQMLENGLCLLKPRNLGYTYLKEKRMDLVIDWEEALAVCKGIKDKYPPTDSKVMQASSYMQSYRLGVRTLDLHNKMMSLQEIKQYVEILPD